MKVEKIFINFKELIKLIVIYLKKKNIFIFLQLKKEKLNEEILDFY